MILNKDTNIVYLSDLFKNDNKYDKSYNNLINIFNECDINYSFIKGTKDIWCRDYMPIQLNDDVFIQFNYNPSYLNGYENIKTDTKYVNMVNNINVKNCDINLDGGNIISWNNKVIITDRIFDDNKNFDKKTIIKFIENSLESDVIIIPQIKNELTGHADGLVRFINEDTLIGINRETEYKYWSKKINKILKENNLNYIDIPTFYHKEKNYPHSAIGCYINYLEISNYIIMPIFEINNMDDKIYNMYSKIFKNYIIKTVNINDVAVWGGLLNCITWNIKKKHI